MFVLVAAYDGCLLAMIETHIQLDAHRGGRTFADAQTPRFDTLYRKALPLQVKGLRRTVPARFHLHE